MRIAILGGGNGAFAATGELTLGGHEVRLWRREAAAVAAHRAAGGTITVIDATGEKVARPALITAHIAEAIEAAHLILCALPAFAQSALAALLAPHLRAGQVVYLPPGTFGSYIIARAAREAGNHAEIAIAESGTLPWLARKQGPYEVRISARGVRLPTGVFPLGLSAHALQVIGQAFPDAIVPAGDILSAALLNAGPIIHPPLIIMNAGPLERCASFDIHNEGTQPAIRGVTDRLDAERIAVRENCGYGPPHFPLKDHYADGGERWMYSRQAHDRLTASSDWREPIDLRRHRYMLEDTRLGLSFLISVAELTGVPVPLAHAFLSIGSAITAEDFLETGRSLASLGLGRYDLAGLKTLLREGFRR